MAIVVRFGREGKVRSAYCSESENVGDFVYLCNEPINGMDCVRKADPSHNNRVPAIGVIISKQSGTVCRVQYDGETPPIYDDLEVGKVYFLNTDATPVRRPPDVPELSYMYVQTLAVATSPNKLFIKPSNDLVKRIGY